jgi:hypothetical protein
MRRDLILLSLEASVRRNVQEGCRRSTQLEGRVGFWLIPSRYAAFPAIENRP